MNLNKNNIYIELHVPDFDTTIEFYKKLGFDVISHKKENEHGDYLIMARENSIICFWPGSDIAFEHSYFKQYPKDTKHGYGVELIIPIENIESFYYQVKDFANVVSELKERPWGAKDFRIEDPFGYYFRFTEPYDIVKLQ